MTRGPRRRHGPALVVVALVGAAALVVWLARPDDESGRAPARSAPRDARAGRSTPVVDLSPPSSSSSSVVAAPRTVAVPRSDAEVDTPLVDADESQTATNELDPPPSIRGVRGLVRDGRTGAPIAHAWITWRRPSDAQVDEVLRDMGPDDVATGMITGTDGRFDVDRLPDHETVASSLFAVAAGYSSACLRPGLRNEVVFDLFPMGSLEVRVSGLPPPEAPRSPTDPPRPAREPPWVRVEPVPADPTRPTAVARIDERSGVGHASHLAPGRWSVQFMNGTPTVVEVMAGRTTVVEVAVPSILSVDGGISGTGPGSWLSLTAVDDPDSTVEWVLEDGRFSGELRAGRYRAALLLDEDGDGRADTERNLTDTVEVRPGATSLQLHAPPRGEKVQVTLTRAGQGYTTAGLGLVALDGPLVGSLIYLFPDPTGSWLHRAEAPAGRYALFEDAHLLSGELALPAASGLVFATDSFGVPVRFALPSTLRPEEMLRGRASLIPRALSGELARRFLDATEYKLRLTQDRAAVTFEIVAPGQYLVTGETDLGPFEAWVDLAPGVEVTVPLGE